MEVLRDYLEAMFSNMPDTEEVRKAKQELWSMMEDKYNSLIAAGKQDNEAIGTVLSEFGNFREIVESLGIKLDGSAADEGAKTTEKAEDTAVEVAEAEVIVEPAQADDAAPSNVAAAIAGGVANEVGNIGKEAVKAVAGSITEAFENTTKPKAEIVKAKQAENRQNGGGKNVINAADYNGNILSVDDVMCYVSDMIAGRFLLALGIMLCIFSPAGPILGSALGDSFILSAASGMFTGLGVALMFVLAGIGTAFIILSSSRKKEWKFIDKEPCLLDNEAIYYARTEKENNGVVMSLMLSLGIALCVVSLGPVSFFGAMGISKFLSEGLGPSLLFILSGIGVFFIIFSTVKDKAYSRLLKLNGIKD